MNKIKIITEFRNVNLNPKIREKGLQMSFYGIPILDNSEPIKAFMGSDGYPLNITDLAMKNFKQDKDKLPLLTKHTEDNNPYNFDAKNVIGYIQNIRNIGKRLLADVYLISSDLGRHASELINQKVMFGISIEMNNDADFNRNTKSYDVNSIKIFSAALVSNPACESCYLT